MLTASGHEFNIFVDLDRSSRPRTSLVTREIDEVVTAKGTWNGVCARTGTPITFWRHTERWFDPNCPLGQDAVRNELQGVADPQFICDDPVIALCPTLIVDANERDGEDGRCVHTCTIQLASICAVEYVDIMYDLYDARFLDSMRQSDPVRSEASRLMKSLEDMILNDAQAVSVKCGMHLPCSIKKGDSLINGMILLLDPPRNNLCKSMVFFSVPVILSTGDLLIREIEFTDMITKERLRLTRSAATVKELQSEESNKLSR